MEEGKSLGWERGNLTEKEDLEEEAHKENEDWGANCSLFPNCNL